MVITIFDALGIQDYLFGSNRLAENVGASYLVNQALESWPMEAAREVGGNQVNLPDEEGNISSPGMLDGGSYDMELLYSAGGNAVFLVQNKEKAMNLAMAYSQIFLKRAPGLEIACHHHEVAHVDFQLDEELQKALIGLAKTKTIRIPGVPLLGLGVTQACASGTQEPAVDHFKDRFLGPSALAKLKNRAEAQKHLNQFALPQITIPQDFAFPLEFDDLGRSRGEKSFIGIVHADGNGIGKKLQNILSKDRFKGDNQAHLDAIRKFSKEVKDAGIQASRAVIEQMIQNWNATKKKCAGVLDLATDDKKRRLFPFRPLVYGGDDITFICDGRIALDLAATCLNAFAKDSPHYACAGIALVKSHYPFSQAYALAEELCRHAKQYIEKGGDGSAMDWQIVTGGPIKPVEEWRKKEYVSKDGKRLTCRPYRVLPKMEKEMRDWDSFRNGLLLPLKQEEPWVNAHSRLKGLAAYLRRGSQATGSILKEWSTEEYEPPLPRYCSAQLSDGFHLDATPYLDALELLDFMVPLK